MEMEMLEDTCQDRPRWVPEVRALAAELKRLLTNPRSAAKTRKQIVSILPGADAVFFSGKITDDRLCLLAARLLTIRDTDKIKNRILQDAAESMKEENRLLRPSKALPSQIQGPLLVDLSTIPLPDQEKLMQQMRPGEGLVGLLPHLKKRGEESQRAWLDYLRLKREIPKIEERRREAWDELIAGPNRVQQAVEMLLRRPAQFFYGAKEILEDLRHGEEYRVILRDADRETWKQSYSEVRKLLGRVFGGLSDDSIKAVADFCYAMQLSCSGVPVFYPQQVARLSEGIKQLSDKGLSAKRIADRLRLRSGWVKKFLASYPLVPEIPRYSYRDWIEGLRSATKDLKKKRRRRQTQWPRKELHNDLREYLQDGFGTVSKRRKMFRHAIHHVLKREVRKETRICRAIAEIETHLGISAHVSADAVKKSLHGAV